MSVSSAFTILVQLKLNHRCGLLQKRFYIFVGTLEDKATCALNEAQLKTKKPHVISKLLSKSQITKGLENFFFTKHNCLEASHTNTCAQKK